jgi:predicted ATPase
METKGKKKSKYTPGTITSISVQGFKSFYKKCNIKIRPLTILAGANSSGKSSAMQPLLMMKQTLESSYDPGSLLIFGADVRFTSSKQLLSKLKGKDRINSFEIGIEIDETHSIFETFMEKPKKGLELVELTYLANEFEAKIKTDSLHESLMQIPFFKEYWEELNKLKERDKIDIEFEFKVRRSRCFLTVILTRKGEDPIPGSISLFPPLIEQFEKGIRKLIHVPALRGNPERTYKTTATGPTYSGTFDNYVASIIHSWQTTNSNNLSKIGKDLELLGLTWKVSSRPLDDTQVEIKVGRLMHSDKGGAKDLVNIADVGFGVSQTLPVLVALLIAEPGQLVYIEQPEIHLHPRAQYSMAQLLSEAAKRGVQVIVETHSTFLLLGVQSLVAEGKLSPEDVMLQWFKRDEKGVTEVYSANLDDAGSFGDWPEDFAEVELLAESRYLDAVEERHRKP